MKPVRLLFLLLTLCLGCTDPAQESASIADNGEDRAGLVEQERKLHRPDIARLYLNRQLNSSPRGSTATFYCRMAETYIEEQKQELVYSERINTLYLFAGLTLAIFLIVSGIIIKRLAKNNKQLRERDGALKETPQRGAKERSEKDEKSQTKFISPKSKALFARAEQEVKTRKRFRNKKLRITDLAETLETNSTTLSECINVNAGVGFNDWINRHRIGYLLKRLNDTSQIETLHKEAGFTHKSTFYASFKKETGRTPGEYLQKQAFRK